MTKNAINKNSYTSGEQTDQGEGKRKKKSLANFVGNLLIILALLLAGLYFVPSNLGSFNENNPASAKIGANGEIIATDTGSSNSFLKGLSDLKRGALGAIPSGLKNLGKDEVDPSSQTIEIDPNAKLYSNGEGQMLTYSDSAGDRVYAPTPARQFRNATCDLAPQNEVRPSNNSWTIPSINQSASWGLSGFNNKVMTVPPAPMGTMYASDALFGDTEGALLQLGHVNYNENPWAVSPWGYLYKLQECAHIYQTDHQGNTYEFVATDLYTVSHTDFPKDDQYFRKDGDLALYMVTCSGPRVGDAGAAFTATQSSWDLGYEYNLVVKAVPVKKV